MAVGVGVDVNVGVDISVGVGLGVGVGIDVGVGVGVGMNVVVGVPFYDPMISKLIVWGRNRSETISRMQRALYEYIIVGPRNNIPFHQAVMENLRFISGNLGTHFIEKETTLMSDMMAIMEREIPLMAKMPQKTDDKKRIAAIAAVAAVVQRHGQGQVFE